MPDRGEGRTEEYRLREFRYGWWFFLAIRLCFIVALGMILMGVARGEL